ncbi:MAG: hypothetical protein Q9N02_11660 [Ghiorsea sp.]|nr:hypothetical protein [Ghiorsea sp.]
MENPNIFERYTDYLLSSFPSFPCASVGMHKALEKLMPIVMVYAFPPRTVGTRNDPQELAGLASKVAEAVGHIAGVVDVRDGIVIAGDAITIKVDRARAALEGLNSEQVTRQVNMLLAGQVTTAVQVGQKVIGVRLWSPDNGRDASISSVYCSCRLLIWALVTAQPHC